MVSEGQSHQMLFSARQTKNLILTWSVDVLSPDCYSQWLPQWYACSGKWTNLVLYVQCFLTSQFELSWRFALLGLTQGVDSTTRKIETNYLSLHCYYLTSATWLANQNVTWDKGIAILFSNKPILWHWRIQTIVLLRKLCHFLIGCFLS